ncbi:gamma-glutamyl-gamma-aminobutyrate hydrolase family protein [Microvirga aerilata]|jgi:putative glutamine amidotransferase|uniref:Gamma-glutamyl-gamma-aminobutyrate hydrolase family protein n=1 Tax=Microvirga aerilata TaxID=670292 RepID=A0A936ZF70_9HYPH|nr:gamma-glutamyl-gamma-aminobutyrate hydrolase family protein [Microvirga aerilata]MBL0404690.1 gamma-glutamyl-gamma-aminobutyrate hydrolase family protein [Microvirga aerilata]
MTSPLIGVTTSRRGGWRSYLMHRLALARVGARSIRLMPGNPLPAEPLQGLIIGGGDDIGAEIYGGKVLPDVRIDPERDKMELGLLKAALPAGLPILGICRGSQMINVGLGGTLHTDIYEVYVQAPKMRTVLPRKTVSIAQDSRLDRILRCNPCQVNALHHQSVDRLGQGLRIAATDESGIVQAIESESAPFLLGVQWHPELLVWKRPHQRLFGALADAAREVAQPLSAAALAQ